MWRSENVFFPLAQPSHGSIPRDVSPPSCSLLFLARVCTFISWCTPCHCLPLLGISTPVPTTGVQNASSSSSPPKTSPSFSLTVENSKHSAAQARNHETGFNLSFSLSLPSSPTHQTANTGIQLITKSKINFLLNLSNLIISPTPAVTTLAP